MVLVDLYDQAQKDVLTACSNTPASSVAYSIHLPPPMPTFHVGDDIIEDFLLKLVNVEKKQLGIVDYRDRTSVV